jgi:hypothetical protein
VSSSELDGVGEAAESSLVPRPTPSTTLLSPPADSADLPSGLLQLEI